MMSDATEALFRVNSYLRSASARVAVVDQRGGIHLDRTIFYATSGGQPGDTGRFRRAGGEEIRVAATVTGATKDEIIHLPETGQPVPSPGEELELEIDWERRFRLMRMHTACHLLSVVVPFPITGASVGEAESRVDFDLPESAPAKEEVSARLMALVEAGHPVSARWIEASALAANPGLVKSKHVRPPADSQMIRLVCIGAGDSVDSQPCGGTHVSNTSEVGAIHIRKIEKKGRENRRFRLRFGPLDIG